ncbi:MAG: amino acid adenylation domain-containing protein, partial [Chthoniobacterales bacterium]
MQDDTKSSNNAPALSNMLEFPAAMSQEAFYYLERLRREAAPYNIAVRFLLQGELDCPLLERSFQAIIERHESLRTQFEEEDGELLQIVLPAVKLSVEFIDISHLSGEAQTVELERLGSLEAQKSFHMSRAPLLRVSVVRLSAWEHVLHITIHHTVADGWSIGVIIDELTNIYDALANGHPPSLPDLPIQYADFSAWQREFLAGAEMDTELTYWKKQLQDYVEADIPTDHPRPPAKLWHGDIVSELLPVDLTERLKTLAQKNGATLFHVFLAAFKILLSRYSGNCDITVGSPIAGRNRAELEPLIGTFINSILLRTKFSENSDFSQILKQVRDTVIGAMAHQDLPFESLVRALKPERDPSRNPLFQINFTHQRDFVKPATFANIKLTAIPSLATGAIFDLHFFMVERDNVWRASCDFCTDLFDRSTAIRMLEHFHKLLENISRSPELPVKELSLIGDIEQKELDAWSVKSTPYPRDATLAQLFLKTAETYSDKVALIHGSNSSTYGQLATHASHLALELQKRGVVPGVMVAVAAKSSPEAISALLAVTLAGGAYVPLDTDYPPERIKYLLEDTKAPLVITDAVNAKKIPPGSYDIILLDLIDSIKDSAPVSVLALTSMHPAYVMYTSGSTGEPKGVVVPHRAVIRLVCETDYITIRNDDVFLQGAPLTFDAATFEIWGALLNGATLVLPQNGTSSLSEIAKTIRDQHITTAWLSAGLFQAMVDEHLDDLRGLRNLLAGGDILPIAQVRRVHDKLPNTRLINGYGPTENSTFTACHTITKKDLKRSSIPIGHPVSNTSVRILDSHKRDVPIGIRGEIFTGGDGLALGYLNNPALTAEKFIIAPNGERLYRTGDLGRWNEDTSIEFLGRSDQQVKIRGFRVEPSAVEEVLSTYPGIGKCKVAARGDTAGDKKLIAWVSPASDTLLNRDSVKDYLTTKLPAYLRPDAVIVLDSFPLTANGKININALPTVATETPTAFAPPVTETEKELATIWCELLGIESVGRDDNFFELGGHSLLGLRLFSRIRDTFGLSLPLASLLSAPTIHSLADLLADAPEELTSPDA